MKKTILASASPRRKELIASLPIQIVSIIPAQNELPYQKRLSPEQNVAAISAAKAENVSEIAAGTEYDLIIAADTIVVIDDRVLGKPRDGMEAISMLSCLSYKSPGYIVIFLVGLALFLPNMGATVRRLHDTGHSGWWVLAPLIAYFPMLWAALSVRTNPDSAMGMLAIILLCGLIMLVIGIIILVWLCQDSEPQENEYGPSPKYQ